MTGSVVDASVALAWCFPDEASDYADAVLIALEGQEVLVPAVWPLEVTIAVAVAQRRKRVSEPEVRRFVELRNIRYALVRSKVSGSPVVGRQTA